MSQAQPIDLSPGTALRVDAQTAAHQPGDLSSSSGAYAEVHGLREQTLEWSSRSHESKAEGLLPEISVAHESPVTGFITGLGQSFVHSLVQSPLEGLSQTFDHTLGQAVGSNLYAKTKDLIINAPKPAAFGTAEWHGQAIGGALGIIPWFLATRSALRCTAGLLPATEKLLVSEAEAAAGSKLLSKTSAKLILEGGTTAAAYAGVFKPIGAEEGNYWTAKSAHMTNDFATFATLTASSIYLGAELKLAAAPLLEKYPGALQLTQRASSMLAGGLSGIPAAAASSVVDYAQSGGSKGLKLSEFGKNAYSFAVVGASLSAGHLSSAKAREVQTTDSFDQPFDEAQTANPQADYVHPDFPLSLFAEAPLLKDNYNAVGGLHEVSTHFSQSSGVIAPKSSVTDLPWEIAGPIAGGSERYDAILTRFGRQSSDRYQEDHHNVVKTAELAKDLSTLPNADHFKDLLAGRSVGQLPEPFLATGLKEAAVFGQLDLLAKALRSLDTCLPPQKKSGLGAEDLGLPAFSVGLGNDQIAVSKVGIGEVAHVYKLSIGGHDYAFKVPNDPARMDVHGTYFETAAFVQLSKEKISDLIDFHAANPGPAGGWMLTEFVSKPVERAGRPVAAVLADQGLFLGDDWSANRGPGNVVWDLGGIEPKGVQKPQSVDQLGQFLFTPEGQMIAGRKLDGIKDQEELKTALLTCLDFPSVGGQVARTAARRLTNPADLSQVLSRALEVPGAAGRVAFELDRLENTPFIKDLFYKALKNPESRVEAAKQIDKLPPQERKAAFDAAMVYPEARAMAARSIPSLPGETERLVAATKAWAFPGSNFVQYDTLSKVTPLTEAEHAAQQHAFEAYFDSFGLATGSKLSGPTPEATFDRWLKNQESNSEGEKIAPDMAERLNGIWSNLNDAQKAMPAEQLLELSIRWNGLTPAQWRSMTAEETAEFLPIIRKFGTYSSIASEIFARPDSTEWITNNLDASVPNVENILARWDTLPSQFKKLDAQSLGRVTAVWDRMDASDWAKIPAKAANDVATTVSFLNLYPSSAQHLTQSPDFAKWFCQNDAGSNFSTELLTTTLKMWHQLTPEQKTLPVAEVVKLGQSLEIQMKLGQELGPNSAVVPYLLSLEQPDNSPLRTVSKWLDLIKGGQTEKTKLKATAMVEQLASDGAPVEAFDSRALGNRLFVDVYFGDNPAFQAKLAQQCPDPRSLAAVLRFVGANEKTNKPLVELAIEQGFTGTDDQWTNLRAAADAVGRLGVDSVGAKHLLRLQSQGFRLNELASYLGENPASTPHVKELVEQQADRTQLDARRLVDRDNLARLQGFNAHELGQLEVLQSQGLSITRLLHHIKDTPGVATAVNGLLAQGATVKQVNDFMQLAAFPIDVDLRLVESIKNGEITSEDVLAKVKDWQSGRQFRDLLITHVQNRATLSDAALENLHSRAAKMASQPAVHRTGRPDQHQLESVPEAATFVDALRGIQEKIPLDKPIVLLGRDAWPLLPILRLAGRDVHYFLWSRLQNNDEATKRQWLKEVPPNAAVIDTGYSGSIIDNIKKIDPGVTGYLMSSNNPENYPTLLSSSEHSTLVGKIEGLPKLIYRSKSHTEQGGAVSRKNSNGADTDTKETWDEASRWYIERRSRELLRATGLPQWDVWRYSQFVGLTPMERLGLSTKDQVSQHYKSVLDARARIAAAPYNSQPQESTPPLEIY